MTVQNTIVKSVHVGDGSNKAFPITFACDEQHPEYIKVYVTTSQGKPTLTTNYNLNTDTEGKFISITYPKNGAALASGDKVTIYRKLDLEQVLELVNGGPFFAEDIERELDDIVFMLQQINEVTGRSLKISEDNNMTATDTKFDVTFPFPKASDTKTYGLVISADGMELGHDPNKVYEDTLPLKNAAETARDKAQAWAEEAAGASPSKIGGAKSAKQWAADAKASKDEATRQAGIATSAAETAATDAARLAAQKAYNDHKALIAADVLSASNSAAAASTSEQNAATSEANAAVSEANAKTSEINAKASETNAAASATAASTSATNAATSEGFASGHETNASQYAAAAKTYRDEAFNTTPTGYETLVNTVTGHTTSIGNNATAIANINNTKIPDVESDISGINTALSSKFDGARVEDGYLVLSSDGVDMVSLTGFGGTGGGDGGGSSNNAKVTLKSVDTAKTRSISLGDTCPIKINWTSKEDNEATGQGVLNISVNGVLKRTMNVDQGDVGPINVESYLELGYNKISVMITDAYENNKTLIFVVTVTALSISSTFDYTVIRQGAINFSYTPIGDGAKKFHIKVDGTDLAGTSGVDCPVSGDEYTYAIPQQSHGAHSIEAWFEVTSGTQTAESNHLYYEFISIVSGNSTPVIIVPYNTFAVTQYSTVTIPYLVYNPATSNATVILKAGSTTLNTLTVNRNKKEWSYRFDNSGSVTLSLTCGATVKNLVFTVTASQTHFNAVTDSLELYLSSNGKNNSDTENRGVWSYGDISATFEGFDYVNDGWQIDSEGVTCLRVMPKNKVTIPLKIFKEDFRESGKTIEFEFATRNISNYDDPVIKCSVNQQYGTETKMRGFEITGQSATFASAQTSLTAKYKEEEHVRVSFVVGKTSDKTKVTYTELIYCYINGILSGVVRYMPDDDFTHMKSAAADIVIGSKYATVDVYAIRVYSNNLSNSQIVGNWIADMQNGLKRLTMDAENNVYNTYGQVVYNKLPSKLPYMVLVGNELPSVKDADDLTVDGYYVNPSDTSRNFSFTGAKIGVQGTSSAGYVRKNFKLKLKQGVTVNGEAQAKYALREGAVPTSTFVLKADVASSEGANNVELVRYYDDLVRSVYKTKPQRSDSTGAIRQGIDGVPIVVFWNNPDDNSTSFIGKYNFNNDKGTPEVYGFADGDESWETLDNNLNVTRFLSVPSLTTQNGLAEWALGFECRYPDKTNTNYAKLRELAAWINSTDPNNASNAGLPMAVTYGGILYTADDKDYRKAKFKAELRNYLDVDDTIFYYVFTEAFLLVDSRVKNSFPTKYDGYKWCWLPYDMDTAIGCNNQGALAYEYWLEDIDKVPNTTTPVYNGQASVLWNNIRENFADEIKAMYKRLRKNQPIALDWEVIEKRFEEHQSCWPAAIFNEDAKFKYVDPYMKKEYDNTSIYLSMCLGSKAEHRKWWLYNRFRYLDSKYEIESYKKNFITIRSGAAGSLSVVPYNTTYFNVDVGGAPTPLVRLKKGDTYDLNTAQYRPGDAGNTETYIYGCDQLTSIGSLASFNPEYVEVSKAVRLESLIIGSDTVNNNPFEFAKGSSLTMLKKLDLHNITNFKDGSKTLDLSECLGLEELYLQGTNLTSVTLPTGNTLKKVKLPGTIANLTIKDQKNIETFTMESYNQITQLVIENTGTGVPYDTILGSLSEGTRIRIVGFEMDAESVDDVNEFKELLDGMQGLTANGGHADTAQVEGVINLDISYGSYVADFRADYPGVVFNIEMDLSEANALTVDFIDNYIRAGRAKTIFTVGDQIVTKWSTGAAEYSIPWDVVDFGPGYDENGVLISNDCPIVCMHYTLPFSLQFDRPEALYCIKTALTSGTSYSIKNGRTSAYNGMAANTIYHFTPDENIPVNVRITISNLKVNLYKPTEPTAYKTYDLTEGESGTLLFTVGDYTTSNHVDATTYGFNRYKYSAIRQWLNSDKVYGEWYAPTHDYDLAPSYAAERNGFANGFDASVMKMFGFTKLETARNTVNAGGGYDELTDRFFLPSATQMYYNGLLREGASWKYWKDICNNDATVTGDKRKIYSITAKTSAQSVWLRSASTGNVYYGYFVYSGGYLHCNYYGAYNSYGVLAACTLI